MKTDICIKIKSKVQITKCAKFSCVDACAYLKISVYEIGY